MQRIALYPETNKTFHFWHVDVKGLEPGMHYALRVDGPWAPHEGHRFNRNKVLIDPYAKGNTNNLWDRVAACGPDDNLAQVDAQRRARHRRTTTGKATAPLQPADERDDHLRDARGRLHAPSEFGRDASGHVRGRHREDSRT